MTRWLMLILMIVGFALAIVTRSPTVLGIGLLLGLVGMVGLVFSFAADRVSAAARPESAMLDSEDLAAMSSRRAGVRPAQASSPSAAAKPGDTGKSPPG